MLLEINPLRLPVSQPDDDSTFMPGGELLLRAGCVAESNGDQDLEDDFDDEFDEDFDDDFEDDFDEEFEDEGEEEEELKEEPLEDEDEEGSDHKEPFSDGGPGDADDLEEEDDDL